MDSAGEPRDDTAGEFIDDMAGDFLARLGDLAGWTTGEFAWLGSGLGCTCEGSAKA